VPNNKPPALAPLASRAGIVAPTMPGQPLAGSRLLPLRLVDPNPEQSRQVFDEAALADLAQSITAHGVLEPILVRPLGERYQVVAGERRTRAARLAGLADIPAIIREMSDEEAAYVTATENLQREDLDLEDEARWLAYLQELTGLSDRQLAERLGKPKDYVNRRLRILRDNPALFARIRAGEITQRQALNLLSGPDVSHGATLTTPGSEGEDVSHGATLATPGSSEEGEDRPAPRTERAALDAPAPTAPTAFRWRPVQTFATWLDQTRVADVPPDERATFRAQVVELRERLQALERALGEEG
jgi:ParB family chromosome partitioning protein